MPVLVTPIRNGFENAVAPGMENIRYAYHTPNMNKAERAASLILGSLLVSRAVTKKNWLNAGGGLVGVALLRHGITGFSYTRQALGINTSGSAGLHNTIRDETGVHLHEAVAINRPRADVYKFWKNLSNIPEFMEHVESVSTTDGGKRSHWIITTTRGRTLEWDAEIINDVENQLIAWRSLEGSNLSNAGSVHFTDLPGERGTHIKVELSYAPPGGAAGALIARLVGENPSQQLRGDLKRLKARLEAGVLPSTDGQSVGAREPKRERAAAVQRPAGKDEVSESSEQSFPASDAPAFNQ